MGPIRRQYSEIWIDFYALLPSCWSPLKSRSVFAWQKHDFKIAGDCENGHLYTDMAKNMAFKLGSSLHKSFIRHSADFVAVSSKKL